MGLSKGKTEDLIFMLKKRQIDLQVIGGDIETSRLTIDAKTGELKTQPALSKAVNSKIEDIIGIAQGLIARRVQVKIDLTKQHPFVRKRLEEAIQKAGLGGKPMIQRKIAGRIPRKKPLPKRRV